MAMWQVALVLNLTLAVGLGLGYVGWGRRAAALDRQFDAARAQIERLERERQWDGRGVVRAVYAQLLMISHEEIAGLLPARTTGFRVARPNLGDTVRVGDPIRFSLRGTGPDDAALVAI